MALQADLAQLTKITVENVDMRMSRVTVTGAFMAATVFSTAALAQVAPNATPTVTAAPAPIATTAPASTPVQQRTASPVIVLRDIDREMTALSNDISASHSRLREITSMVLEQSGGGAQLIVDHQNEMGSTFRLVRASYSLDGAAIATRTDDNGSLADQTGFAVYNGRVAQGEHTLTVSLEYQGNGYGIFSYIRGFTFRARSVQNFTVPEGRALRLTVVGYERGGATAAIEERPAIRYTQTVMTLAEARQMLQRADDSAGATRSSAAVPAQPATQR
jgi:hypothetical protein